MKKAYGKDILRTISSTKKRFLSILVITALGVTVLTGIYAGCQDLYYSADKFYDERNLFDIRILSTLGLTEDDVFALHEIPEAEDAEGSYSETVYTEVENTRCSAEMIMLSQKGLNMPYVMEGSMPSQAGEIAVTGKYLEEAGKSIGDTLVIEEKEAGTDKEDIEEEDTEEDPIFQNAVYVITAAVTDPMDISNSNASFRSSSALTDYTFFVTCADVNTEVYTCLYLTLAGTKDWDCYSDKYKDTVSAVINNIETKIKEQREQARYDDIINEAYKEIADAESEMNEKFTEAEEELADAWKKIKKAKKELKDGESELAEKEEEAFLQIDDAKAELEKNKKQLALKEDELLKGEKELKQAREELDVNAEKLAEGKGKLKQERKKAEEEFAAAEKILEEKQSEMNKSRTELEAGITEIKKLFGENWPENEWNALVTAAAVKTVNLLSENPEAEVDTDAVADATANEQSLLIAAITNLHGGKDAALNTVTSDCVRSAIGLGIINGGQQVLDGSKTAYEKQKSAALKQLNDAAAELAENETQLETGRKQIEASQKELEKGKKQIADAWEKLYEGERELENKEAKARKEISDAWEEIADGKQELKENKTELIENEQKYYEEKVDAEQEIIDAYEELNDIDMTQWYVQDRISLESYSSLKSDMSSIESVGKAFPVVFLVVAILISLTTMTRMIEEERGLIGTYKALGFSNGAIYRKYIIYAVLACILGGILGDFFGFVVLPEIILFVLKVLYILPNVYLKFDMLYGIGGVILFMAGIVGAAVAACRSELEQMPAVLIRPKAPRNGSRVFLENVPFIWNRLKFLNKVTVRNLFRYKKRFFMTVFGIMGCTALVLAGFAIKDSVTDLMPKQYEHIYQYDLMAVVDSKDNSEFLEQLSKDRYISDYLNLEISNIKLFNGEGKSEKVQMMVIRSEAELNGYINTPNTKGVPVTFDNSGILVTQNAAELLGIKAGDTVALQTLQLKQNEVAVSAVIQNYLGNNVYIKQELYESLFGEYAPNGILAHLTEECTDPVAYAESLLDNDIVLTSISTEALKQDFASNFSLINTVVYLIIILAAGLAFVVLFTLSNTNISERVRELATTKVLGFYDKEVHAYVNKETLMLTAAGILIGLPAGRFISGLLTSALKMPSMYFATYVAPISYLLAAIISFCFALIVNLMTNRTLNGINMVEALKSVE